MFLGESGGRRGSELAGADKIEESGMQEQLTDCAAVKAGIPGVLLRRDLLGHDNQAPSDNLQGEQRLCFVIPRGRGGSGWSRNRLSEKIASAAQSKNERGDR